jgi:UDP-GlcNAc:undecaprenyl-phosphate GlcNAc-1-phosphate transferase
MFLVPIISRLAKRYRLVDAPGPRKVHETPIPRIGGIALVVSVLAVVLPVLFLNNKIGLLFQEVRMQFIVLLAAAAFIFVVGLVDDLRSVPGHIKLLCLIAASLAVCASGTTLRGFSIGTWEIQTGWAAWPLTIAWITVITVCMNLIDGLDGLAAGIAVIVCGTIALLAFLGQQPVMAVVMLALLGSVTGFLFFNFHPAKIFMGDGGSMFLGFLLGASSIACEMKTSTVVGLALPFLVLGVPIFDTGWVVIRRRMLDRRSMLAPDRGHLHHRLLDLGLRQPTVVIVIYAVTAINASIGVLMLTTESGRAVALLAGGLVVLITIFSCRYGGRHRKIMKVLRRNWAIAQEARAARRSFETAEVAMRDARSFAAWWEALCDMGEQMHFQSIGLWKRCNGHSVSTCVWNAPGQEAGGGRIATLSLPVHSNGQLDCEIRACIRVNGYLESSGRQASLLGRLMDDFPPPQQAQEDETVATVPTQYTGQDKTEELVNDNCRHTESEEHGVYTRQA